MAKTEKPLKERILDLKRAEQEAKEQLQRERPAPDINIQPASKIKRVRVKNYFGGRLTEGSFQLMVGPGEAGKGMLSTDVIARFTTGDAFPGETIGREPMNILICVTEDSKERVAARLDAAGADMDRALFVDGPPVTRGGLILPSPIAFDDDAGAMVEKARLWKAGGLFLETMLEHLGDREGKSRWSSNNEAEVRRAMAPIVALCREAGLVGWGVMHPRKSMDGGVEDSISGSAAFRNIGRTVLHVYKDPTSNGKEPANRLFICSKANYLAQHPSTLRFRIEPWERDPTEGRVVWGIGDNLIDLRNAEDVWRQIRESKATNSNFRRDLQVVEAERLLISMVTSTVACPIEEIRKVSAERNIAWRTIEKAKSNLHIISKKAGMPAVVIGWIMPADQGEGDM